MYKLSPSKLNLMQECPRCFWLTLHKIWKRPTGIFPSLPSGMDRILKTHFDRFMNKQELPPELCENHSCKNLRLFDNKALLDIYRNNKKGLSCIDKKGNILMGAVDNLMINNKNNKLIVLDYKTRGYPLKADTHKHYQLQLDVYNFLLRENGYKTEDFAFLLFYVPKHVTSTGEVIFDTLLKKMPVSASNGKKLWQKALKLLDAKCPEQGCEWCQAVRDKGEEV
ncbi:MAG: PD-(D/E)XK nuclease family protein [Candidatus Nanoarchaeia archaeon]